MDNIKFILSPTSGFTTYRLVFSNIVQTNGLKQPKFAIKLLTTMGGKGKLLNIFQHNSVYIGCFLCVYMCIIF